jgi:hypothetical protein
MALILQWPQQGDTLFGIGACRRLVAVMRESPEDSRGEGPRARDRQLPAADVARRHRRFRQCQQLRQPLQPLGPVTAPVPEQFQRPQQPQPCFRFVPLPRPLQRRPEIVVLRIQPFQPLGLIGPLQPLVCLLRQLQEPIPMLASPSFGLSRLQQPVPRILPHRLQQPIPRAPLACSRHSGTGLLIDHQRLIHQLGQQIQHVLRNEE